jgi:teichoic acid transport system permease protein
VDVAAPVTPAEDRAQDDYLGEHHVYTAHRAGLPPLRRYMGELWRRRQFVYELAQAELKAQNYATALGQLWLIFNPLLNASIYLLLRVVLTNNIKHGFVAHLLAGIFLYSFVTSTISQAAGSVLGGGKLILNTAFPRLLLPITQLVVAFFRFLPTLPVLAVAIAVTIPHDVSWAILLAVPVFAMTTLAAAGLGFLSAVLQVYFRDYKNLLPYILRLVLYMSPVLYFADEVKGKLHVINRINPLSPMFEAWSDCIVRGRIPSLNACLWGSAWAIAFFVVGSALFMSREREFAVRI